MSESNGRATIREVWEIVTRLEEKIDARQAEQDKRIGALERWRSFLAGAVGVIVTGLPIVIALWRS